MYEVETIKRAKRILIIDDDEGVLVSFKKILTLKGYDVDTATTGSEAIRKSGKNIYDLALIDVKLPDMEGTELLTKMRDKERAMKRILISGYDISGNSFHDSISMADAFIKKPVELEELLNIIKQKVKEQSKARALSRLRH